MRLRTGRDYRRLYPLFRSFTLTIVTMLIVWSNFIKVTFYGHQLLFSLLSCSSHCNGSLPLLCTQLAPTAKQTSFFDALISYVFLVMYFFYTQNRLFDCLYGCCALHSISFQATCFVVQVEIQNSATTPTHSYRSERHCLTAGHRSGHTVLSLSIGVVSQLVARIVKISIIQFRFTVARCRRPFRASSRIAC